MCSYRLRPSLHRLRPSPITAGFNESKSFTVTGKILKSTFENPHCEIEMEVDGKHWHFILAPPSPILQRGGPQETDGHI